MVGHRKLGADVGQSAAEPGAELEPPEPVADINNDDEATDVVTELETRLESARTKEAKQGRARVARRKVAAPAPAGKAGWWTHHAKPGDREGFMEQAKQRAEELKYDPAAAKVKTKINFA